MKNELEIRLKILKLYKKLFTEKLKARDIENIYIEYLKLSVLLGTNEPCFRENLGKYKHVNCYGYALGIDLPEYIYKKYLNVESDGIRHNLGFASQKKFPVTAQQKLDNLFSDFEVLNINWFETDIERQNNHGGYKIAFYVNDGYDFHLIRQNKDGSWSEKLGYSFKIIQTEKPRPLGENYKLIKTLEIVKPTIK